MSFGMNRRGFLGTLAGFSVIGSGCCTGLCSGKTWNPSQKIKLAVVGIWGKGYSDWMPMLKSGLVEIVAFCDADKGMLNKVYEQVKKEKGLPASFDVTKIPFFYDYRKMLDAFDAGKLDINAITCSTPDHMHAAICVRAMEKGIHCYVQKPLVRTLWENKKFYDTAKANHVVMQMGNQGSGGDGFRRNVEIVQSGILGEVKEVHVWTNRPVWPQGAAVEKYILSRSGKADALPKDLNWDAWLGVAKERPFLDAYPADVKVYDPWKLGKKVYHPFTWRGFFDFGCGAFGDMACHTMNLPYRGLELGLVTKAECTMIEDTCSSVFPMKSVVKLTYAARRSNVRRNVLGIGEAMPEVTLYWYDGNEKPSADLMPQVCAMPEYAGKVPETGCLIVGSKGILCSCADYGQDAFIAFNDEKVAKNTKEHEACKAVKTYIPRIAAVASAGGMDKSAGAAALSADGHYVEFLTAIRGEGPVYCATKSRCYSDVEYAIPLMEGILVGTVAQRVKGVLAWNSAKQEFVGNQAANDLVKPFIRKGFEF